VDSPSHFHSSWRLSLNQSLMGGVLERHELLLPLHLVPGLTIRVTFHRHRMMEHVKSGMVDIPTVVCKFMSQSLLLRFFLFVWKRTRKSK
jgi:hypothetical protein